MELFDNDLREHLEELTNDEPFECTECNNTVDEDGTQCSGTCFESSMR